MVAGSGVSGAFVTQNGTSDTFLDSSDGGASIADWPTDGHDLANTGYARNASGPATNVSARWILSVDGDDWYGDTLVENGTVYVTGDSGVRAVDDATGAVRWNSTEFRAEDIAIADGTLYATGERDSDAAIVALDTTDGSERWNETLGHTEFQTPRVANGVLLVDYEDRVRAYDADSGGFLWQSDSADEGQGGGIAVSDGTVYLPVEIDSGGTLTGLIALNVSDGSERWRFEVDGAMEMTPTVANGTVYVGKGDEERTDDPDPRLYALDTEDGSIRWAYDAYATPHGVAVANGTVYAANGNSVRALDEATGESVWTFRGDGNDHSNRVDTNPPVVANGVVYITDDHGFVYGLDAATGDRQWRYEVGGVPENPVVSGDTLYVRSRYSDDWQGSRVYALEENPFSFSDLTPSSSSVAPGESVTVDVTVRNDDAETREYNLSLVGDRPHVGGETVGDTVNGTLAPGNSTTVTFTTSFGVTGTHDLSVRRELDRESDIGPVAVQVEHATPNGDWPMKNFDAANSNGNTAGIGAKYRLQEAWNLSASDAHGYEPAVVNGTAYIVHKYHLDDRNDVVAFDEETGAERWRYNTSTDDRQIYGSPAATDDFVYLTTFPASYSGNDVGSNATIYGIHASNGSVAWTRTLAIDYGYAQAGGDNAPLVFDDTLYVAGSEEEDEPDGSNVDAAFYALNATTGAIEWTYEYGAADEDERAHRFAVGNGHAYLEIEDDDYDSQSGTTTTSYELRAIDLTTHDADWTATDIAQDSNPLVGDGFVYVANRSDTGVDERLYAFHAGNGTEAWRLDEPYGDGYRADFDGLVLYDGSLYADQTYWASSLRHDRLYELNATTGDEEWNRTIKDANDVAVVDGLLYASDYMFSETHLYDARSGEFLGTTDMGAMVAVANGTLYTYLDTTAPAGSRFIALRSGANIVLSDTTVSTDTARIGENVTVSATATNVGTLPREFVTTIQLSGSNNYDYYVWGTTVTDPVTLAPGDSTTVSYVVEFRKRGDFTASINPVYFHDNGGSPTDNAPDQYVYDEAGNLTVSVGDAHDGETVALPSRTMRVSAGSWPKRGLDAANTGNHETTDGPTTVGGNVVAWNDTMLEDGWTTAPTIVNDTVYVGGDDYDRDERLYAINATDGSIEWGYASPDELVSAPTYADGFVYFADRDRLYAVNATTGHLLWSFYGDDIRGAPTVVNGTVYIGTGDDRVYALNASTRNVRWSTPVNGDVETSVAVSNGTAYVSTYSDRVYAFDASSGIETWNATLVDGYDTTSPVVSDGVVYVGNTEELVALYAGNGTRIWNVSADLGGGESDFPTKPALADGVLYLGDDANGQFRAVNADDGSVRWSYTLCSEFDGAPAVADGAVYFGTNDGYVYALDADDGSDVWNFQAVHGDPSYPVVYAPAVANGVVYVSTDTGDYYPSLYALTGGTSNATGDPFTITGLTVNWTTVGTGEAVAVSAAVENAGSVSCAYTARLEVDGSEVDTATVSVSGDDSESATFVHSFDGAGTYDVSIDGLSPVAVTVTGPEPDISVSPTSYHFGTVGAGNYSFGGVYVKNDGAAPLNWTGATLTGPDAAAFYTGTTTDGTIQPGGQEYVSVNLHTSQPGVKNATLELYSNDTDEGTLSVPISATVVAPEPNASVSPTTYDFGDVGIGDTETYNVTVTNDGDGTLTFDGAELSGNSAFEVIAGNGTTALDLGESHEFIVSFTPSIEDALGANLGVLTDDPDTPEIDVYVSGTGVSTAEPNISVAPSAIRFGNASVGANVTRNVTITNDGDAPLTVYGESFESNQFATFAVAAGGGQTVLAPGESYDVTVRFAPSLPGKFATTMSVTSNDTYVPVQVAGSGVVSRPAIDVSPAWYSFGTVSVGDTATATFTVTNEGTAPLNVTEVSPFGRNASEFEVGTTTPFVIAAGNSTTLTLDFSPASVGTKYAGLRIVSNDTDDSPLNIGEIDGNGVDTEPPVVETFDVEGTYTTETRCTRTRRFESTRRPTPWAGNSPGFGSYSMPDSRTTVPRPREPTTSRRATGRRLSTSRISSTTDGTTFTPWRPTSRGTETTRWPSKRSPSIGNRRNSRRR